MEQWQALLTLPGPSRRSCRSRRHPPTIYLKEEAILRQVDEWLAELFDDEHVDDTCRALADATEVDPDEAARRKEMRDRIAKMDEEIEAYRTILREQPVTAPEVGKWMAETVQDKRRLENLLGLEPTTKLTVDDVKAMVAGLRDITRSLALADPAIKAAAYAELGITVTYHREGRALLESRPQPSDVADTFVSEERVRPDVHADTSHDPRPRVM